MFQPAIRLMLHRSRLEKPGLEKMLKARNCIVGEEGKEMGKCLSDRIFGVAVRRGFHPGEKGSDCGLLMAESVVKSVDA